MIYLAYLDLRGAWRGEAIYLAYLSIYLSVYLSIHFHVAVHEL